jgi:hypothetical protein
MIRVLGKVVLREASLSGAEAQIQLASMQRWKRV